MVSAVVAARLLEKIAPGPRYEPIMQGVANPQTAWLFESASTPLPRIRSDVRPTAAEACHKAVALAPDAPLGEALDVLHARGFSILPVVGEQGELLGAIGHTLSVSRYLTHFNIEDFFGTLVNAPELARGLGLVPLNDAARNTGAKADRPHAAFRVYPGGPEVQQGDAMLAGAVPDAGAHADSAEAALLIHADCDEKSAAGWTRNVRTPAWFFPGSLMALVAQLPRAIPVGRVMSTDIPVAREDDLLVDLRDLFVRTPHALPVLDSSGRVTGMISRREALQPPRRGLVLVDHFERTQTARGWDEADILHIIDHHRVGGLETVDPARIDCRPLGSTATILSLRYAEAGLTPDAAEARLMLGAIVADTLLLTSPTATETDHTAAAKLAAIAGVDLRAFGREVLARNDGLASETAAALVARDLKEFTRGETRFLLGQIETVDLGLLDTVKAAELRRELDEARRRASAAFALTMVTDVLSGVSKLLLADPDARRARHLLEGEQPPTGVERPIVSRKKQLVPLVLGRLATYRE